MTLLVLDPGPLTTVQDHGRPGLGALGVAVSGAADRRCLDAANRALGNNPGAAALETTLGGLRLRALAEVRIVVTGPGLPITVDREPVDQHRPFSARPGSEIRLGRPVWGLRNYLAVAGGIDVPPVLGSRSTDLLSGLGPDPLQREQVLRVGDAAVGDEGEPAPLDPEPGPLILTVRLGPREDRFTPEARSLLVHQEWTVGPESNRVGLRLSGTEPLTRTDPAELPSEPMVPGALQVPPAGQPVLFGADHPVTGGYPVMAVLEPGELDRVGQARPGSRLRFVAVS